MQNERDAMALSENPYIVNLHYSFQVRSVTASIRVCDIVDLQDDEYLYLVMDFAAGGGCKRLIRSSSLHRKLIVLHRRSHDPLDQGGHFTGAVGAVVCS